MSETNWVYIDGTFYPKAEAKISVFDHGLLYGDGVFEGIRAYDGLVFCLDEHLERLYASARAITLCPPLSMEEMAEAICETFRKNGMTSGYCRPLFTRGVGDLGLNPVKCPKASVIIAVSQLQLYPKECYEKGMDAVICATRRNVPTALSPQIKSLNYLNNIMARLEVNRAGVGEGIMLSADGYLAEATADNLFLVKKGELFTPPTSLGALPGITRRCVMDLAREAGITVKEPHLTSFDLYTADECFLTGTGAEVIPVHTVDGRMIGNGKPGPVTRQLITAFRNLTAQRGRKL